MPTCSPVHRMTHYMRWADDAMLRNAERLPPSDLSAPRTALFSSIRGTFDHTLVVAEIFLAHLTGVTHPHTARTRHPSPPFAEVAARLRALNERFVAFAGEWSDCTLSEKISFEFVGGGDGQMSREDILLHLVNHSTYHRGFVSTLLYPHGPEFAATDYTVFLRDVWPGLSAPRLR